MDKRYWHHKYAKLRGIKPRYFLMASLVFFALGVYGLRQNNLKMIELRDAVSQADARNKDVEKPLRELRDFVYSHMNTDLTKGEHAISPPIQLKYRYERLAAKRQSQASKTNAEITAEAEAVCARQYPAGGLNSARVACVQEYLRQNASRAGDVPEELYKFDFVSPRWAPDFAGINLLLSALAFVIFLSSSLVIKWLRMQTK